MQSKNEKLDNLVYCGGFCGCCFDVCFLLLFQIKELACRTINTQNPFNSLKKSTFQKLPEFKSRQREGSKKHCLNSLIQTR